MILLAPDEPSPVSIVNADGQSPFFLTCDHASNRIPRQLNNLGLTAAEINRHIGWDIGALGVAETMAVQLDAPLIAQNYSRLVIDCNRRAQVASSIPVISEHTKVPGNENLTNAERLARREQIFEPYQRAIAERLDQRRDRQVLTALITVHSFTPTFKGSSRHWELSLMYDRDKRLATLMHDVLADEPEWQGLVIGINEPYIVDRVEDYGIPVHGDERGVLNLQFEIRQDLIEASANQRVWGERLARWLRRIEPMLPPS